ncbi:MAG: conjugal transfer protein TraL [Shewanella xiamenensis]|uniref:nucleotide-binding protein n=1 Tax=Shewanella TaxID=22 RepID=UPI000B4A2E71|nr:conjugal transfer protein TraL [Shewanella sp. Shew256]MCD8561257.1 conjugal transfer protein TraL [Shewanella xiamenensis]
MKIHIVLQGKGGVGKSLIAALIAQYKLNQSEKFTCIDTDPVNASLSGYKSLNVKQIKLLSNGEVDSRSFDSLIETIYHSEHDIIIDNGASCFIPFSNYLLENNIIDLIQDIGHEVIIHTVITGGQAAADTLNGFVSLIQEYPENCAFVVWLNPFWGPIEINGKDFENMQAYSVNKDRVAAIVRLPSLKKETFGIDFENMLKAKQTFDEAINDESLTIMNRQRLKMLKTDIFKLITAASIV